MEEAALNLERLGDGRALLVTQPIGEEPAVATFDKIDRAWNKTQRHNSPLTGAYSCCRMNPFSCAPALLTLLDAEEATR